MSTLGMSNSKFHHRIPVFNTVLHSIVLCRIVPLYCTVVYCSLIHISTSAFFIFHLPFLYLCEFNLIYLRILHQDCPIMSVCLQAAVSVATTY